MRMILAKCSECRKPFERPANSRREVCCKDCERARKNRLNREHRARAGAGTSGRCLHCGSEIPSRQRYCKKPECQKERKRRNNEAAQLRYIELMRSETKRQCPYCGKWFDKRSKMFVTCGDEPCVRKRALEQKRENYRRRAERRSAIKELENNRKAAELTREEIEQRIANTLCPFAGPWKDDKGMEWPAMQTLIPGVSWSDPIMGAWDGWDSGGVWVCVEERERRIAA